MAATRRCPKAHVCELCEVSRRAIELVHNGNERIAIAALKTAVATSNLHRVILGTDSPAGSGVQPLGILRMIALLSGLGGLAPELAVACATGNTARMRKLDCGIIEKGRPAISCSSTRPSIRPARTCSVDRARRSARHRHGGDRRHRAHRPQPQHAPRREGAGSGEVAARVAPKRWSWRRRVFAQPNLVTGTKRFDYHSSGAT